MAITDYHFLTHWRVEGTAQEVYAVLQDANDLPRWWPSVYLGVEDVQAGDGRGVGRTVALHTKGWLPYDLYWQSRMVEANPPHGLVIMATGDLTGRGEWILHQDGRFVDVTFDWRIRADKPLLRTLSPLFKPLLAANHRWAMRQGETSLRLELARRQAPTPNERAAVSAPLGPTRAAPFWLGLAVIVAALAALAKLRHQRNANEEAGI